MTDLAATIETTAAGPKSVQADGIKIEAQDLDKLANADQYLATKAGVTVTRHRGLRHNKLSPPGTA